MSFRWILPFAACLLSACAATPPEQGQPLADERLVVIDTVPRDNRAATVDEHLFEPVPDPVPDRVDEHIHESVWERMMHSFALPDCGQHELSRFWTGWYAERPDYMARVFKRAEPWIHFIVEELELRGMPGELALLPIVESAYDPFAYSSGRALGMWQFISSTGRHYGLQQNWWYDGRRDVWAATHAALNYLQDLHRMFDGDWLLALASYNSGEGRVQRSVAHNAAAGKPTDFWNIRLPRETRGYVPKLLGLTCLFLNAEEHGFQIPATADKPVITAVELGAQADLVLISQAAGVDIDVLFTLNPGFNRWATSPEGPYRVILPIQNARRLETSLGDVNPSALMKWDQISVERGDTLSRLAQVHDVPVEVIRVANGLQSDLIRVGQKLRLPRDQQLMVDPLYAAAAAELAELQSGLLAADRRSHTVRSGESLSVIARRYRVSVRELQAWNNISDPHRLRVGQRLTVFLSPAPKVPKPASTKYTVRTGDSLWSIAREHKVKLKDLMRWNGLSSSSVLRPGQSLIILF